TSSEADDSTDSEDNDSIDSVSPRGRVFRLTKFSIERFIGNVGLGEHGIQA
ncbi:hypothetical protein F442_15550, partial [Phytophthora nicotianae P10297]